MSETLDNIRKCCKYASGNLKTISGRMCRYSPDIYQKKSKYSEYVFDDDHRIPVKCLKYCARQCRKNFIFFPLPIAFAEFRSVPRRFPALQPALRASDGKVRTDAL